MMRGHLKLHDLTTEEWRVLLQILLQVNVPGSQAAEFAALIEKVKAQCELES